MMPASYGKTEQPGLCPHCALPKCSANKIKWYNMSCLGEIICFYRAIERGKFQVCGYCTPKSEAISLVLVLRLLGGARCSVSTQPPELLMGTSHFTQTGHTVNPVVYRVSKTLHLAKNELHFFFTWYIHTNRNTLVKTS